MNYLIQNTAAIASTDAPEARDIRIRDGRIAELGQDLGPTPESPETMIDASDCEIWPGLVNTHHHLAQSIMKGVPAGLNQGLGEWLGSVPYLC